MENKKNRVQSIGGSLKKNKLQKIAIGELIIIPVNIDT